MTQAELAGRDASAAEADLLARLRAGDEAAFEALVARHYGTMLAVAQTYVKGRSVAEEVVQETWLAVIQGLDRFEGPRLAQDLDPRHPGQQGQDARRARVAHRPLRGAGGRGRRAGRGARALPRPEDAFPGHWRAYPGDWRAADVAVEDRETLRVAMRAIAELPPAQQTVDPHARRRGVLLRGGVLRARRVGGQPARAAAPRALEGPRRARGAPRWLTCTRPSTSPARRSSSSSRTTSRDALTPDEAALFEQHLNFCDGCDWYVDQLRATIATVGRIEPEEVPEAMRAKLLNAFRDRGRS